MSYERALQALADPTRREIFERLRKASASVGEIATDMPVTRPAVSQHLKVLKDAGLVREERQGVHRVYQVELKGLVELRRYIDGLWGDVLKGFERAARQRHARQPRTRR
jgi:DNA-binding transcriptional ArsR family regulator